MKLKTLNLLSEKQIVIHNALNTLKGNSRESVRTISGFMLHEFIDMVFLKDFFKEKLNRQGRTSTIQDNI